MSKAPFIPPFCRLSPFSPLHLAQSRNTNHPLPSSCYNNCQDDPRKVQAEGQVQIYCANASIYAKDPSPAPTGSSSSGDDKPSKPTGTGTNAAKPTTTDGSDDDADADESGDEPSSAADLALNAGSMLLAVAGVMAVVV